MTRDTFEKMYSEKGGLIQLRLMMDSLYTLKRIAEHFGVSRERVRQWTKEMFGVKYDPREARRKRK